jgi:peptide chain release factor 2
MQRILSLDRTHFEWQFFRAGGKGGQKQNKTSSACRCIHRASGAVGESREERKQSQNRKLAFLRCVKSPVFQTWIRMQAANIEQAVDRMMLEENIKVEYYTPGCD